MRDSFFEFADEQVLGEGWWPAYLESWSLQLRNDTKMSPQLKSFLFIITSIVYGHNQSEPTFTNRSLANDRNKSSEIYPAVLRRQKMKSNALVNSHYKTAEKVHLWTNFSFFTTVATIRRLRRTASGHFQTATRPPRSASSTAGSRGRRCPWGARGAIPVGRRARGLWRGSRPRWRRWRACARSWWTSCLGWLGPRRALFSGNVCKKKSAYIYFHNSRMSFNRLALLETMHKCNKSQE